MSAFDPDSFINTTVEGRNSTVMKPIPEGEYEATITAVDARTIETKDGPKAVMDVSWTIEDEYVAQETGRPKSTARQSVWLDLDETGSLAMGDGENVDLGRLREALGLNDGKFTPAELMGQRATVRIANTPKKDDPEVIYSNVKSVAAL